MDAEVQCAALPGSLADSVDSLKAELLGQRLSVTYGQRHSWHVGIISGCAGGRRLGMVCVLARSCSSEVQRDNAGFTPSVLKCSVNTVTHAAGPRQLCRAAV